MREPRWVERLVVDAVHWDQIREHGGLAGVRDENALESALARPRQQWQYEETTDLSAFAAAYGFGLCRNHPYRDGNKRVAFVVMAVFLELNGLILKVDETDVVAVMVSLADAKLSEQDLATWLREHCTKYKGRGGGLRRPNFTASPE